MARLAPTAEAMEMVKQTVPMARTGTRRRERIPSAGVALAGYVTGVVLPVDGDWALGGASQARGELAQHRGEVGT